MPKTKTYTVFQYDELTDRAKEKAREWYARVSDGDTFFAESVIEDFLTIAPLLGIETDRKRIAWSGFASQGDGACFAGQYRNAPNAIAAIAEYAPTDTDLATIARDLADVQAKYSGQVYAKLTHTGRYSHKYSVTIDAESIDNEDNSSSLAENDNEAIADSLRALMSWLYRALESAYDYEQEDSTIADNIRANEYDFNEDGTRHSCR